MHDHPIKILLVEDNPGDADLLRELLSEASAAGYAVTWADRLATGLARLAADAPDVVFLDLSLPDSQGLATFRALRDQAPAVPIIVLTGLDDDALALAAVREGAQDYLVKGQVDSNLLGRAIRYAIERQEAKEALRRSALRLEVLHQVDQAILTARPLAGLVQMALAGLRRLAPCRSAAVILFDSAPGEGTILAAQAEGETRLAIGTRLPTDAALFAGLQRGEVRVIEDLGRLAELPPVLQGLWADGVRSLIHVPLLADGELLGMLTLTWQHRGACSPEQIEIAREIADQLAIAIQQARLRGQVARHTAELEQRVADRTAELSQREAALQVANDKLKELDRFKSSFVSDVAHELRQPLSNIKTYLWLLDRGKPEKRVAYMATLHRETDLLQQLIEDLLHLSRIDLGKVQPVLAPLDINQLVGTLVEDRAPQAAEHGLALQAALAPALPPVLADAKMVTQVLTNLLANAMNYTPAGGTVTVRTGLRIDDCGLTIADCRLPIVDPAARDVGNRQSDWDAGNRQSQIANPQLSWVTFSVSDTGPGIAAEEQTHLFERFYRGEAARQSRASGTGLGLPICRELVERHGGHITVESQVGQGSTFTVWLPAAIDDLRLTIDD